MLVTGYHNLGAELRNRDGSGVDNNQVAAVETACERGGVRAIAADLRPAVRSSPGKEAGQKKTTSRRDVKS